MHQNITFVGITAEQLAVMTEELRTAKAQFVDTLDHVCRMFDRRVDLTQASKIEDADEECIQRLSALLDQWDSEDARVAPTLPQWQRADRAQVTGQAWEMLELRQQAKNCKRQE